MIALHSEDHPNRKRFSCAHEIGHFVARAESGNAEEYEFIDYRGSLAAQGTDPEEVFANQFAANLLMPKATVQKLHKEGKSHIELALFFGVSAEAMQYRLNKLGLR